MWMNNQPLINAGRRALLQTRLDEADLELAKLARRREQLQQIRRAIRRRLVAASKIQYRG